MVRFPLHLTLYCIFSFTSARQRELISSTQTRLSTAYLEKPIILVAYVGFEPMSTIHALLTTAHGLMTAPCSPRVRYVF
jgi:hypothetical protein